MQYPASFYVTAIVLIALAAELWRFLDKPWVIPALIVYTTVGTWYYADLFLYGDKYKEMSLILLSYSYWEIFVFLIVFRLLLPRFGRKFAPASSARIPVSLTPEKLLPIAVVVWAFLLVIGTSRMEWDFLGALFPLDSRTGNTLWARAAAGDAGATGFLVSTGGYFYLIVCSFFGVTALFSRNPPYRITALAMMALTWPFFLLGGTRNQFLVVAMPCVMGYALFGRQPKVIRLAVLVVAFLVLNFVFKVVLAHRNVGFRAYFAGTEDAEMIQASEEMTHEGLNMIEELCFINAYQLTGQVQWTWGEDYLTQIVSIVPRAIWPGKPMTGIEYAKMRGFEGGDSDIGVVATLSTGLVGQGVLEFGPLLGPLAPGVLMAIWCGCMGRWWRQRASILRLGLFLLSLGVTFNLGRNITSITFWPVIFAYVLVRIIEKCVKPRPVLPDKGRLTKPAQTVRQPALVGQLTASRPAGLDVPQTPGGMRSS